MNELKLTQVELFSLFHFKSKAANKFKLIVWLCKQIKNAFNTILVFILNYDFYIDVNSPVRDDEIRLKFEKVRFFDGVSEINSS